MENQKQNAVQQPHWAAHPAVQRIIELDGPGVIVCGYGKHRMCDILESSNMRQRILRQQSKDPELELVACLKCDHHEQSRERKRLNWRYRQNRNTDGWLILSAEELTHLCQEIRVVQSQLAWAFAGAQAQAAKDKETRMAARSQMIRRIRGTGEFVVGCAERECQLAQQGLPRQPGTEPWIKLVENFRLAAKRFGEASLEVAAAMELAKAQWQ
jgi:Zn ribbon nucleic-acid-binding protein